MELGLATFADLSSGVSPEQRMRDLLEEATLADELGLDVFAVGEPVVRAEVARREAQPSAA